LRKKHTEFVDGCKTAYKEGKREEEEVVADPKNWVEGRAYITKCDGKKFWGAHSQGINHKHGYDDSIVA
jgi:hypothetical protein